MQWFASQQSNTELGLLAVLKQEASKFDLRTEQNTQEGDIISFLKVVHYTNNPENWPR